MAGGEFGTPGGLGGGFALGLGDLACGRFQLEREALFFCIQSRETLGELTSHHSFLFKKESCFTGVGLGLAERSFELLKLDFVGGIAMAGARQVLKDPVEIRENRLDTGQHLLRVGDEFRRFFDVLRLRGGEQGFVDGNREGRKIGFERQVSLFQAAVAQ